MAQAKKREEVKEPEVKTPEPPETKEQKPQDPKEEIDTLRQQLTDAEAGKTKAEEEAKAHQKNVSKKDLELQKAVRFQESIDDIKEELAQQQTFIAQLGDKVAGAGGPSFSQTLDAQKRATLTRKSNETLVRIDELLKGTGLDKNSPELEMAKMYFERAGGTGNTSDYARAIKKVEEAVAQHEPPETEEGKEEKKVTETEEERIERLAKEKSDAFLEEKGLLTPEGGEPSAGGGRTFTIREIKAMSSDDYAKNKADIDAAMRGGRVK